MKGIYCTEFGKDTNIDHIIGNNSGNKTTYDINRETFMENGENLGVIELVANDINIEKINPKIMEGMKRNLDVRLTEHALKIKGKMVEKDNQQEDR